MRTNFALCFLIFLQCINYEEQAALKVGRHAPSTRRSWEDGEQKKLLLHLGMLSSTYYKGSYFCCWSRPLLNFFLKKKPAIFAESNLLTSKLQPRRGLQKERKLGALNAFAFSPSCWSKAELLICLPPPATFGPKRHLPIKWKVTDVEDTERKQSLR